MRTASLGFSSSKATGQPPTIEGQRATPAIVGQSATLCIEFLMSLVIPPVASYFSYQSVTRFLATRVEHPMLVLTLLSFKDRLGGKTFLRGRPARRIVRWNVDIHKGNSPQARIANLFPQPHSAGAVSAATRPRHRACAVGTIADLFHSAADGRSFD